MSLNHKFLEIALGHHLQNAWRIFYEFKGQVDESTGALELEFDNTHLFLRGASDGEKLFLSNEPWQDFYKSLTQNDEGFVKQYGRHVKTRTSLSETVSTVLTQYCLLQNQFGTIAGLELVFESTSIIFLVESDECYVMNSEDKRLADWNFGFLEATRQSVI